MLITSLAYIDQFPKVKSNYKNHVLVGELLDIAKENQNKGNGASSAQVNYQNACNAMAPVWGAKPDSEDYRNQITIAVRKALRSLAYSVGLGSQEWRWACDIASRFERTTDYVRFEKLNGQFLFEVPTNAPVQLITALGAEVAKVRYIDNTHFESSNIHGEFDAAGSHVWHTAEFAQFCDNNKIRVLPL